MTKRLRTRLAALIVTFILAIAGLLFASPEPPAGFARVTNVVDGDTIDVTLGKKAERVRLLGVDSPESVDPRRQVECFGQEAADFVKRQLSGKNVRLEADTTQSNRDSFGRLLRYVWLADGTNFNQRLIDEGFAHEYTFENHPYKFQKQFQQAETDAKEAKRGLWNPATCPAEE